MESRDSSTQYYDPNNSTYSYPPIECYIDNIKLVLEFTTVLDLNTTYTQYNPSNSTTDENIRNLVKHFLENYDFDNIGTNSTNHNNFYKYVKLSGNITGTDARRNGTPLFYNTIDIRIKSR